MALRRKSGRVFGAGRRDVSTSEQWSAVRRKAFEDGMSQLLAAMEGLEAVDDRLRAVEDSLTSGDALALPRMTRREAASPARSEANVAEAALAIASTARRLNLRLGAVERALDGHASLGVDEGLSLRAASLRAALDAGVPRGLK